MSELPADKWHQIALPGIATAATCRTFSICEERSGSDYLAILDPLAYAERWGF